jgi:hypothetical protein
VHLWLVGAANANKPKRNRKQMTQIAQLTTPEHAKAYILADNAKKVTLVSEKTGARFTFNVKKVPAEERKGNVVYFVGVLTGPDNMADYRYLGLVRETIGGLRYEHGAKSKIAYDAPSAKAFDYAFRHVVNKNAIPQALQIWHQGTCGRCLRPLTDPASIARGLGPICAEKVDWQ